MFSSSKRSGERAGPFLAAEREPTTGMLAKGASFRLILSGNIGVKEIERLIQTLKIDKEILADQNEKKRRGARKTLSIGLLAEGPK